MHANKIMKIKCINVRSVKEDLFIVLIKFIRKVVQLTNRVKK